MRTLLLVTLLTASTGLAADWPMHRANAARTAGTTDLLPKSPALMWTWKPMHAPNPAWPGEPRLRFDTAFHPVIAGGVMYVASNADDQLRAFDATTGKALWTFFADGPMRFAPAVADGKAYVGSDDGYVYCLDATSGKLVWKTLAATAYDRVMGNGRMISRWPVRGGVAVRDGKVYAAAGFWATDVVYLLALDAKTGTVVWRNDKAGEAKVVQPGETGAAFQGYLTVSPEAIIAPNGRIGPSMYRQADGSLIGSADKGDTGATSHNTIIDGIGYSWGGGAYLTGDMRTVQGAGASDRFMGHGLFVAANERLIVATNFRNADEIHGYVRDGKIHMTETTDRLGKPVSVRTIGASTFHIRFPKKVTTGMIVTGDTIVASDANQVFGVKIPESKEGRQGVELSWTRTVDGNALGLAVADGRLYVSTDAGTIYCFGETDEAAMPLAAPEPTGIHRTLPSVAAEIVKTGGVTHGLCIDLDCGDGVTAMDLARRTNLRIYGLVKEPERVAGLRKMFADAGLYGTRVTIHQGGGADVDDLIGLDGYADLVISSGGAKPSAAVVENLLSPYRGVACLGKQGEMKVTKRGAVAKAGNWTHFYADAGNTLCSNDEAVRGPLQIRWYRDVIIPVPSRHGRSQPPLVYNGLMIIAGLAGVAAVSAYNGETIWKHEIPGLMRAHNNGYIPGGAAGGSVMCVGDDLFFIKVEKVCYVFNALTGEKLRKLALPQGAEGPWGYVGYADGVLVGSVAYEGHSIRGYSRDFPVNRLLTESRRVFGVDAKTGKELWSHKAEHFVKHMSLAIGGGTVCFIDRPLYEYETPEGAKRHDDILDKAVRRGEDRNLAARMLADSHKPGRLASLDLRTGAVRWKSEPDVRALMTLISPIHNRVYVSGHGVYPMRDSGGGTTAYNIVGGAKLWTGGGSQRLWLNGDVLVANGPVDAVSGAAAKMPYDPAGARRRAALGGRIRVSGGKRCGIGSYSRYMHIYRDGEIGYTDSGAEGVRYIFGGVRSGCWTTNIPANGLVLQSDSGYGCQCGYPIQASFGLEPIPETK